MSAGKHTLSIFLFILSPPLHRLIQSICRSVEVQRLILVCVGTEVGSVPVFEASVMLGIHFIIAVFVLRRAVIITRFLVVSIFGLDLILFSLAA